MMNVNCIGLGFAAFLLAAAPEANCLAGPPTAWEEVIRMGPGINLGNTFDAPDGGLCFCRVQFLRTRRFTPDAPASSLFNNINREQK